MKRLLLILLLPALLQACGGNKTEKAAEPDAHQHEEGGGNVAEITAEQLKTAGIETDTVQLKNLTSAIKANGMLTVPNQNKALVTSVSNGIIKTLLVQPGDFVKQGQAIASIINPDIAKTQQDLQTVQAQISLAEIEQRRQKELVEGNAAPLKNLQRVETELATLTTSRNALQQQLAAMGIPASAKLTTTISVRAPISGTISEISAQIGSNVGPNTPIAQIVNNSQLHLDLFVYEKDLPKLKPNQVIHFTMTNNAGKEYDAQIYSIGTAFASDTKTIPIHAVVKGDKTGLIEGMSITAVVSIGKAIVPAVPSEAIITNAGTDYIFIQTTAPKEEKGHEHKEGEKEAHAQTFYFEKTPVIKGNSDIGFTEIIPVKPIPSGARVVTKGAFFVMATLSNMGEHEH